MSSLSPASQVITPLPTNYSASSVALSGQDTRGEGEREKETERNREREKGREREKKRGGEREGEREEGERERRRERGRGDSQIDRQRHTTEKQSYTGSDRQ